MNILDELNEKQREAVTHKEGPLLVIAGPGTGKTKVITHRIAYLIREHGIKPENILAITFTNKAAEEMRERVNEFLGLSQSSNVQISTFHAFCHRTLRQYASEIGVDEDFTVLEQEGQTHVLTETVQALNFDISNYKPDRLRNIISNFKNNLEIWTETSEFYDNGIRVTDEDDATRIRSILEMYEGKLVDQNALDFDDLLFKTVNLFETVSDVKKIYEDEISYILVDEYHDVNKAQYRLLQLLCAPPKRNIMVVADKDQTIYSWRGSDPQYIDDFKADFDPHTVGLTQHYRCTDTILSASKMVIAKNLDVDRPYLETANSVGEEIVHCTFSDQDENEEAQRIIRFIRKVKNNDNLDKPSIAIFYRNHKFADTLTRQLALLDDMPFRRWIQTKSLFEENYEKAIISYLSLLDPETRPHIDSAINFPDICIDELTLLQLKRLAGQKNTKLMRLLQNIDSYPQKAGPLTRENIRQFWTQIDKLVANIHISSEKASSIVLKLINILEGARSPYHSKELEIIEKQHEDSSLTKAVDVLHKAVENGDRIYITASYGIDEYCAARILAQTFENYLNRTVQVQFLLPDVQEPQLADKGIHLLIGDFGKLEEVSTDMQILLIGSTNSKDMQILPLEQTPESEVSPHAASVRSILTLKLCQHLVGSFEIRNNMMDTVVYDLETTGLNTETANIVEIAACRLNASGDKDDPDFYTKVKPPNGYIPPESTDIHHISEDHVTNEKVIKDVLPEFCEFIEGAILVGHNISRFDNPILERDLKEFLKHDLTNSYYDTLTTARRLFPHEQRSLEALANRFKIEYVKEKLHTARQDVEITREIFKRLVETDFQKRIARSLTEFLPFVGLAILAKTETPQSQITQRKKVSVLKDGETLTEIDAYLNAAKRFVQTRSSENRPVEMLKVNSLLQEPSEKARISNFLKELRQVKVPYSLEDREWNDTTANIKNIVLNFEKISEDHSLQSFLKYQTRMLHAVRRFENINNETKNEREKIKMNDVQERLSLMSLHTAKGTEFDVVIILGMENGIFPQMRGWTSEAPEEERRLFYVGMTRAKKRLYLVTSMRRFNENQGNEFSASRHTTYSSEDQKRAVSMFVHEIPADYIQKWP